MRSEELGNLEEQPKNLPEKKKEKQVKKKKLSDALRKNLLRRKVRKVGADQETAFKRVL